MDFKLLKRDKRLIHDSLVAEGDTLVTKTGCKIYIPVRYAENNLAVLAGEITILGIFAMVIDDKVYGVSKAISMLRIEPSSTSVLPVGDEDYYEFYFEPGSVVIADTMAIKDDVLPYYVYNEFIAKGRVPAFLSYLDMGSLFEHAKATAGLSVGANRAIMEVVIASISRQANDLTRYYRQWVTSEKQLLTNPPAFIPFKSVIYGATNTTARLMGSNFEEGLTSALVNPSERLEPIEEMLRR